ncbi:ribonuclease H-like domain-containing protein [Tanacetum coccineum]
MTITANLQDLLTLIQIHAKLIALIQTRQTLLAQCGYTRTNNVSASTNIVNMATVMTQVFVRDNNCGVEFDAFGCSVNDLMTCRVVLRCDSTGDLYPLVSPLPKSYTEAFSDPNWKNAMCDEYNALIKNNTWSLAPRPTNANIVRCMWLFHYKYLADGTLSHYKALLVANGSTQLEGIDVDETFSLIFKPDTIRTVCSLATSRHWLVHQLDVKNSFLHEVSLWAQAGLSGLGTDTAYLLLYVDDIRKYVVEILERVHMVNCNPTQTLVDTESKLGDDGDPISHPTLYQYIAGYL